MTGFQDFNVMGTKDENPPECNVDYLKDRVAELHNEGIKLITKIRCWKDEESGIYRTDEPIRRFPLEGVVELAEDQWWGLCYRDEVKGVWVWSKGRPSLLIDRFRSLVERGTVRPDDLAELLEVTADQISKLAEEGIEAGWLEKRNGWSDNGGLKTKSGKVLGGWVNEDDPVYFVRSSRLGSFSGGSTQIPRSVELQNLSAEAVESQACLIEEEDSLSASYCEEVWNHCADLARTEHFRIGDDDHICEYADIPIETRRNATSVLWSIDSARGHFKRGDFERCAYELLMAGERYSTLRPKAAKVLSAWSACMEDVLNAYHDEKGHEASAGQLIDYLYESGESEPLPNNSVEIKLWGVVREKESIQTHISNRTKKMKR